MKNRLLYLYLHYVLEMYLLAGFQLGSVLCFENRALFYNARHKDGCSQSFHVHEKTLSYHVNLRSEKPREASM